MASRVVEFVVKGESIGQGSMQSSGRAWTDSSGKKHVKTWTRHNNPKLLEWRSRIAAVAQSAITEMPFLEPTPVRVVVTFFLGPPQRPEHLLPVTGKDLDKLARAACDSMTGVVYSDDRQVTELHVKKRYAADRRPRAEFRISEDDEVVECVPPLKKSTVTKPRVARDELLWDDQMYRTRVSRL